MVPAVEDTFDETAGATVADILDPPDKPDRDISQAFGKNATASPQADASTRCNGHTAQLHGHRNDSLIMSSQLVSNPVLQLNSAAGSSAGSAARPMLLHLNILRACFFAWSLGCCASQIGSSMSTMALLQSTWSGSSAGGFVGQEADLQHGGGNRQRHG